MTPRRSPPVPWYAWAATAVVAVECLLVAGGLAYAATKPAPVPLKPPAAAAPPNPLARVVVTAVLALPPLALLACQAVAVGRRSWVAAGLCGLVLTIAGGLSFCVLATAFVGVAWAGVSTPLDLVLATAPVGLDCGANLSAGFAMIFFARRLFVAAAWPVSQRRVSSGPARPPA